MSDRPKASDFETPSGSDLLGDFSNHEALAFGLRSVLASLPLTWIVIAVYVIVLLDWVIDPRDLLSALMVLGLTVGILVAIGWGTARLRSETPHAVQISNEQLVARWEGTRREPLTIPFEQVAYVQHPHWKWVGSGKGRYASYVPPGIEYLPTASPMVDRYAEDDPSLRRVVLTESNAKRVRAAVIGWRRAKGLSEDLDGAFTSDP